MTLRAAHRLEYFARFQLFSAKAQLHRGFPMLFGKRSAAMYAEFTHQTLGDDDIDGICQQESLDAHLIHPGDCRGRIVCMQGTEGEVTGIGQLHRCFRRNLVANLTHHHDVRVMTQNGANGLFKAHFVPNLQLSRASDHILHRVFAG